MIKDTGDRTEFETGAVRDMHEGKGRCDLLPLGVVAKLYNTIFGSADGTHKVLLNISYFINCGDVGGLYNALQSFVRDEGAFDGIADMILEVAKHFEEGAKKYGENNWRKGIPVKFYIDSAIRHYMKWLRGDQDEPHNRAFCWNIMCAIWTCENLPELNDYRKEDLNECN